MILKTKWFPCRNFSTPIKLMSLILAMVFSTPLRASQFISDIDDWGDWRVINGSGLNSFCSIIAGENDPTALGFGFYFEIEYQNIHAPKFYFYPQDLLKNRERLTLFFKHGTKEIGNFRLKRNFTRYSSMIRYHFDFRSKEQFWELFNAADTIGLKRKDGSKVYEAELSIAEDIGKAFGFCTSPRPYNPDLDAAAEYQNWLKANQ